MLNAEAIQEDAEQAADFRDPGQAVYRRNLDLLMDSANTTSGMHSTGWAEMHDALVAMLANADHSLAPECRVIPDRGRENAPGSSV